MPLIIRPIESGEEVEIYRGLIGRIFPGQQVGDSGFRQGGRVDYLALRAEAPIGVGSILYSDNGSRGVTEIFNIGVAPEHRRAGYGRRILMHLCAEACRIRPRQDRIITPHAANAPFYEMFGFVAEGAAPSEDGKPRLRMRQCARQDRPDLRVVELG